MEIVDGYFQDHGDALRAVARIGAIPTILRVVCQSTGLRFAAVARVTEDSWVACAVRDEMSFGIGVGDQLDVKTTLCREVRLKGQPVAFDQASTDPVYRDHITPKLYGFESYVSMPIVQRNGSYFGNLCALDPLPVRVADARTMGMLQLFAELIALQLEDEDRARSAEAALLDAQETGRLREEFIAVLGHDLRNPLSSITSAAELLIRSPSGAESSQAPRRILLASGRMARLIDDVQDFARGRLGCGLGLDFSNVSTVGAAIADVVAELRNAHPKRLILDRIGFVDVVRCDIGRLQQLVSNLLGNAMEHGDPAQPVGIDVGVERGWLVISVMNGGNPIPPEDLAKVFEPYWRRVGSKPAGGLGLGLYICARIVKEHDGSIEVTSSLDAGTHFTVKIPVATGGK